MTTRTEMRSILLLAILINLSNSQLPEGFYRVPSCPTPNNLTAWKEASAALNCTDDLENVDPRELIHIYHCMPSNYLNETVEFCGKMTAISEGNCPVLNYEHGATAPTGRPCTESNFTNGCPTKQFFTREIYKHQACLNVNTRLRCYNANPQCATRASSITTLHSIITTEGLMTTTTTTSDPSDNNEEVSLSTKDIVIIIFSVIFCLAFIIFLIKCRRRIKIIACNLVRRIRNRKPRTPNDDDGMEKKHMLGETTEETDLKQIVKQTKQSENGSNGLLPRKSGINQCPEEVEVKEAVVDNEKKEGTNGVLPRKREINHYPKDVTEKEVIMDNEKREGVDDKNQKIIEEKETGNEVKENIVFCESEDTKSRNVSNSMMPSEAPKVKSHIWHPEKETRLRFNNFYFDLVGKIIERDLVQKISMLLQDTKEENTVCQRERFIQWNKEHDFQNNLWHLQQLLKKCGAEDLVAECTEFAFALVKNQSYPFSLVFFENHAIQGKNRELITIHTTLDISQKDVRGKMEGIRDLLASLFHLPLEEVQLCGVKEGSLIFVFSLPKVNVKEITEMNLSSIWPLKVFRIETNAWIIEPGLLTSKCMLVLYVQVEQHKSRMQERLQILGLAINNEMKAMGFHIKIDERNIKCTIGKKSCAQGRTSNEYKPHPFEKEILENMEPSIVKEFLIKCLPGYRREIEELFSSTNARRQTAKAILLFLSGKKEKSFKNTTNRVIDMYRNKDITPCEIGGSMDSAMAEENGLFQNTERLFDEIDSSVIEETLEEIGDVPFDIIQKCSPGSGRSRKERAKTFYDFVNRNKKYFEIFKKTFLKNNSE